MAFWCRDCWEERLGFFQRPSPLFGWEVLEKSARENHIKDQLRNEKHTTKSTKIISDSWRAVRSCWHQLHTLASLQRQNNTNTTNTMTNTQLYKSSRIANLCMWLGFDNLKILSPPRADVLLVHFHCLHGPAGETLPYRLNLNLAAFREILSLSGVPMYMSSCCSWSLLPSLSFLHKQHYLARNYLSQTLQLGSNLTCEISDSAQQWLAFHNLSTLPTWPTGNSCLMSLCESSQKESQPPGTPLPEHDKANVLHCDGIETEHLCWPFRLSTQMNGMRNLSRAQIRVHAHSARFFHAVQVVLKASKNDWKM